MKFWTWTEIKARLDKELDLDEYDGLVDATEMLDLTNDAIDEAESLILATHEDYFLTKGDITLVDGTDEYDIPTDIYGMKIRGIIYNDGATTYEVHRIRDWKKFLKYRIAREITSNTENYRYFAYNETAGEPKILLTPPAYEDGQLLEIWYIRNANRLTTGTDKCDIPEFIQFILWHVKEAILSKDSGPLHQNAKEKLEFWRGNMITTLEDMTLDTDNEIEADFRHYDEAT